MFSPVNSLESGVRENKTMGVRRFFKSSGLCWFVHMRCAPDSDLKVIQKYFMNAQWFWTTSIFYFADFIISKCKLRLIGEYHEFTYFHFFSSTDPDIQNFSTVLHSTADAGYLYWSFSDLFMTRTSQMEFFVQPNTSHSVTKTICIQMLLEDDQVLVPWLRLHWW